MQVFYFNHMQEFGTFQMQNVLFKCKLRQIFKVQIQIQMQIF